MARSRGSSRWLQRHVNDEYVKRAQRDGYRSRASYKLLEILDRDRLIRPGMTVVDLGAAPGGWSQIAAKEVGGKGRVIALDILDMEPIPGVEFLRGDFLQDEVLNRLETRLDGRPIDLVISDIAPNISGLNAVDQPRSMYLCELALDFAVNHLREGGGFVTKIFQGEGFDDYVRALRAGFSRVVTRKPRASRAKSREVYLVADRRKL